MCVLRRPSCTRVRLAGVPTLDHRAWRPAQVGVRSLWEKYFDEAMAVIYVVDAADAGRMTEAREALRPCLAIPPRQGFPGHLAGRTGR